jgi:hypothetical protein
MPNVITSHRLIVDYDAKSLPSRLRAFYPSCLRAFAPSCFSYDLIESAGFALLVL